MSNPPSFSAALPLADEVSEYQCPNESFPVSRAVHLGRLASGYAACEQCAWRFEGPNLTTDPPPVSSIQVHEIRRTDFGIRGRYLNAVNRQTAAALTTVITSSLLRRSSTTDAVVAVGYDDAPGAPDVFAGVLSAAVGNCDRLINAGRTSAAGLSHCLRVHSKAQFGLVVTGAGALPGETGIDIISRDGRAVSVPWAETGIPTSRSESGEAFIRLPSTHEGAAPRSQRHAGAIVDFSSESAYQRWVGSWWTSQVQTPFVLSVPSVISDARKEWLRDLTSKLVIGPFRQSEAVVEIDADDRFATFRTHRGRHLPANELADWINLAQRTTAKHVTAHVTLDAKRVYLCDVASPDSADGQSTVCDGYALAGLIANLAQNNPLP